MRRNIVHIGASELKYEIREITELGHEVAAVSGRPITWENIGDPVQKGETVPDWIKAIVARTAMQNAAYAYCPTRGLASTREFLAAHLNARGKVQISPDDIVFFNGLGDAINKIYSLLRHEARVIGPSPSYSTHSSAEAAHAGSSPIVYRLLPERGWMPDLEELRNRVKYNDSIAGLMIINPDNPTGAVYPPDVVRHMVSIARDYDLFIIADEIYTNLVYGPNGYAPLSDLVEDVPAISLKGISKELPWPGARCGWMEVYNQASKPMFRRYVRSILDAKMLEVCSTTLPQMIIPEVYADPRYQTWKSERNAFFARRAQQAIDLLSDCPGVVLNRPNGAFYLSVVFADDVTGNHALRIGDRRIEDVVRRRCPPGIQPDRKFCYELLGARDLCVVPLSSFVCELRGFRSTLLERDDAVFERTYRTLAEAITEFVGSA
ncbi:MAG: pyridoxal phosphate-dependent aminotransferase [Polyangiaceae bacterium]|nr:pyridoxal phosphate-dependent aminotransferase [Polyangiaceae bacterium]